MDRETGRHPCLGQVYHSDPLQEQVLQTTGCLDHSPRPPVHWSLSSVSKQGLLTCGGLLWPVATVSRSESTSRCDLIAATRPTGMEPPPTYYSHPPGLSWLIVAQISSSSGFMLDHESYCSNKNEKRQTHTIHFIQLSPSSMTQGTYKGLHLNHDSLYPAFFFAGLLSRIVRVLGAKERLT